ncbi:uncharacterized protein LOC134801492 [Cydia splendana]|uniref:uncharacterized protein LOC134801492 n=1 Tax=Cydia splendana TaxID=1100963 RepID=UPI002122E36A
MVNYCCVQGCGRNSKQNKHLNYYSLPKEKRRQVQWLQAAGRTDLLEKDKVLVSHRFCSRHFPPSSIKNKHLCDTAVPSLCLPGTTEKDSEVHEHKGIVCDSCGLAVSGFRYKCVSCADYDLCQKCEMRETHPDHYMLRMPKPLKHKLADDLIGKWRQFFSAKHATPESDSDDEPITKYRNHSSVDLTEEVKRAIRAEVARVSKLPEPEDPQLKRKTATERRPIKRIRMDGTIGYDDEDRSVPEVVFADVNEDNQLLEVKHEVTVEEWKKMVHVKISDDLTELMIEVPQQNAGHTSYTNTG